jgi:protein-tyrosine-phosphatase
MKNKLLILGIVIILITISFVSWQFLFKKKTILFLCVHNSFRSQMAEAYFNKFAKEKGLNWQAKSAGFLEAKKINEKVIILMKEEGIDISQKKPKLVTAKMKKLADKIVVVCKECAELKLCAILPKDKDIEHWNLNNPAEMELSEAREIRNLVKEKVINLIEKLKEK